MHNYKLFLCSKRCSNFLQPPTSLLFLLLYFFGWMRDRATFDVLFYLILWIYSCQDLLSWYQRDLAACFFCNKVSSLLRFDTCCGFLLVIWTDVSHTQRKRRSTHRGKKIGAPISIYINITCYVLTVAICITVN